MTLTFKIDFMQIVLILLSSIWSVFLMQLDKWSKFFINIYQRQTIINEILNRENNHFLYIIHFVVICVSVLSAIEKKWFQNFESFETNFDSYSLIF